MSNADPLKWRAIQSKYAGFTLVEERLDYEAGLADGKRCADRDHEQLRAAGERRIFAEVTADGQAYRDSCLNELGAETRAAARTVGRELELTDRKHRLGADYNHALQVLDIGSGPSSPKYEELRVACNRAEEAHDELRVELHRRPMREIPTLPYRLALLGVFGLELPLNAAALELLNDLQRNYNIAYAAGIGFGIVVFSHILGKNARQIFGARSIAEVAKRAASIALSAAALLLMLAVLAQWREQLLHVQSRTVGEIGANTAQIVHRALEQATINWFKGLSAEAVQLTLLNALLIAGATVASFFRVDPDARYDEATRQLEKATRRFERHRRAHEKALGKLTTAHHEKIASLNTLTAEAAREIREAGERVEQFKQAANAGVHLILAVKEKRIASYQQGFAHGSGYRAELVALAEPKRADEPTMDPVETLDGGEGDPN